MTVTLQEMAEAGLVTLSNSQDAWNTIAIAPGSQPSQARHLFYGNYSRRPGALS
jgi:hypothetical protein